MAGQKAQRQIKDLSVFVRKHKKETQLWTAESFLNVGKAIPNRFTICLDYITWKIRCQKQWHVGGILGDFSTEKSKIWGATTTPHIVPSAKSRKKAP